MRLTHRSGGFKIPGWFVAQLRFDALNEGRTPHKSMLFPPLSTTIGRERLLCQKPLFSQIEIIVDRISAPHLKERLIVRSRINQPLSCNLALVRRRLIPVIKVPRQYLAQFLDGKRYD